jgi:hypothetical protein
MLAAGFTEDEVDRVLWRNPVEFFAQSGRLELSTVEDTEATFAGNSILRGCCPPPSARPGRNSWPRASPPNWPSPAPNSSP